MSQEIADERSPTPIKTIIISFIRIGIYIGLITTALFVSAGTLNWIGGWTFLAIYLTQIGVMALVARRTNPEIFAARNKRNKDTKPFDKVFVALWVPLLLALPIVSGLDAVRFGWAPLSDLFFVPGIVLMCLGGIPVGWAMAVNRNLETTVRIQHDRGHQVCQHGPYRYVRHPMYLGAVLGVIGYPMVLGSTWAFVPAGLSVVLLLWRTSMEDATLRRELEGYESFTSQTRHRLFPGVW